MAEKLGIDLVWFGVLLAVNMQTSFMHPPFGFALFYLRSVAPNDDYDDRITQQARSPRSPPARSTGARCRSCIIQVLMVGLIIAFPKLVSSGLGKEPTVDVDKASSRCRCRQGPARNAAPTLGAPPATRPRRLGAVGAAASGEQPSRLRRDA